MGLSDRYNRGDGRIQRLDRCLTEQGDRFGKLWANETGLSRDILTKGLYLLSAWASLQHFMMFKNPEMPVLTSAAVLLFFGAAQSKGGIVEQIQSEASGLPKNAIAFLRLQIIFLGLFFLVSAIGQILSVVLTNGPLDTTIASDILFGLTLFPLQMGEYIRRTNPPTKSGGGGIGKLIPGSNRTR